jgi:hypothetical protein
MPPGWQSTALQAQLGQAKRIGGTWRIDAASGAYLARLTPVPERYGADEFLATVVPLRPIKRIQQETLFYLLALLVLALPLYAILAFIIIGRRLGRRTELFKGSRDDDE